MEPPAEPSTRQRAQVVERIEEIVKSRGHNITTLERLLDRGRGYVAEAMRGNKRLTVELILEILAALKVPAEEFFALPRPPRGWRSEIAEVGGEAATSELPSPIREDSLLMKALVLELADKGVITIDALQARLQDLGGPPPESGPATPRR